MDAAGRWEGLWKVVAFLLVLTPGALNLEASQVIYTKDEPPNVPKLAELPLQESVSQHGITWTFDKKAPVGQFVNGDYYIVGPATVIGITPRPADGRNGSVLNLPPIARKSGLDDRVAVAYGGGFYDPGLRAKLPIRMKPGDSLVSTISVDKVGEAKRMLFPKERTYSPVRTAAVLTCMATEEPADAFRPSYCDASNRVYLARNLRRELLPSLPRVKDTPRLEEYVRIFQRPWMNMCFFGFDAPIENMPDYPRESARAVSIGSLLLCCDFQPAEKEKLLINFVQVGIDHWGILRPGHPGWPAHGGYASGRKWPIVFAGIMLSDSDMMKPCRKYPEVKFGEDMMTMYGEGWTGAKALYAGHMGKDGHPTTPGWGAYEHLHPSEWVSMTGERYRRCCTSITWVGEALAARIMHAEKIWDHDAFFDYVDRWMTEDDTEHVRIIKEATGTDYSNQSWMRQGSSWDPFVNEMWAKYRHDLPPAGGG